MHGWKTAFALLIVGGAGISYAFDRPAGSGAVEIRLRGFSSSNYRPLNANLGREVCVTGRLSVNSQAIHFPLQPVLRKQVADLGYSRIIANPSPAQRRRDGFMNHRRYTICGALRDATPFRVCDRDECKWYQLDHAEVRRGPW